MLVRFNEFSRMAFEVERAQSGCVTIYLPGAPDPWAGIVAYVDEDRVQPLPVEFSDAVASLEMLGRSPAKLVVSGSSMTSHVSKAAATAEKPQGSTGQ